METPVCVHLGHGHLKQQQATVAMTTPAPHNSNQLPVWLLRGDLTHLERLSKAKEMQATIIVKGAL